MAQEMTIERLAEIVSAGFARNDQWFSTMDSRFAAADERFTLLETIIEKLAEAMRDEFVRVYRRFDDADERANAMALQLHNLEDNVFGLKDYLEYRLEMLEMKIEKRFDIADFKLAGLFEDSKEFDKRLTRLEATAS